MTQENTNGGENGVDRSPQICISGDETPFNTIVTSQPEKEQYEELIEQYGFRSKSEAGRMLLAVGMKAMMGADPRNYKSNGTHDTDHDPVTVRELIPEGEENAVDIRDELTELIEQELPEIIQQDPEITQDGWEVYR